ncbi:rhamnogalacturonan acetylesterase [Olivibacter sp. CPCC 100613]|uniref:rhamnogalacturonan acetylesterase n=1 Tax=Olivibacter sp. CPCC 100613 TaxID=3079931 RepID=UPI002FF71A2C
MYKKTRTLLLICSLIFCAFTFKDEKITVWMMGDSTMAIKDPNKYPETGWGVPFATLFKSNVKVENRAKNGRSTRSFINEGRWQEIYDQLKTGDYLFIQFGHNDEKLDKPKVGTDIRTFKANLCMFIAKAREKGAKPILLSAIARRHFEQGVLVDTHKGYPAATHAVADSLKVPFIDLTEKTNDLLTGLGEQKSVTLFLHLKPGHKNYPEGVIDNTHLNRAGAMAVAKLAVEGMKELRLDLVKELK